jgi:hypothetical protein
MKSIKKCFDNRLAQHVISMVNRSRDQSQELPKDRSWLVILSPYSPFHSQTFFTNDSRPKSCRQSAMESRNWIE